jgi:hypothetical protein
VPAGLSRRAEINLRKSPQHSGDNDVIDIRVRLEADVHQRARGVRFLASASF